MSDLDRFRRAETIFAEALARPAVERAAFVAAACGDDEALRRMVAELLAHDDDPHALLSGDDPGASERDGALERLAPDETPPERIGPYRIIRRLGEGGMGTVHLAEQERPQRLVALKVLRADALSVAARRRFEREAEVLGRLRHPGIAAIHEAGTADGRAYFAMEYVPGLSLVAHARERGLDDRARVALLAQVCDAVQHAHEQGVVHRDLKPSNILVDEDGRPRVLDFGVARLLAPDRELTLQTDAGALVGTIPYMSPEQVRGDPSRIDARTDVYALGALAYELLAGRLPHDLRDRSLPEAIRIIAEQDPPSLGTVSRAHRGDLATIVAKALERDPGRRYPSAAALADDLRRFLADEPIVARPATAAYQLRKFARRHKALAGAIVLSALALVGATVVSLVFAFRAIDARNDAVGARGDAENARAAAEAQARIAQRRAYLAGIASADARLRLRDLDAAAAQLGSIDPTERGPWEYRHLAARLDDAERVVPLDGVPAYRPSFAPDGTTISVGGFDRCVRIWDVATGRLIRTSEPLRGRVSHVLCRPDGTTVALDYGGSVWEFAPDAVRPRLLAQIEGEALRGAIDDRSEHLVVTTTTRSVLLLRRTATELVLERTLAGIDAAIAPDGRTMAVLTEGDAVVLAVDDGTELRRVPGVGDGFRSVEFSPDGTRIAVAAENGSVRIASWTDPSRDERILGLGVALNRAVFTPDDRTLVVLTRDNAIVLWDLERRVVRATLMGHRNALFHVAISPDGLHAATTSADGSMRLWSLAGARAERSARMPAWLACGAVDSTSERVALGDDEGGVHVLGLPGLESRWTAHSDGGTVLDLAWLDDDRAIATVGGDGRLRLWRADDGAALAANDLGALALRAVSVAPRSGAIALGAEDGTMLVLDGPDAAPRASWRAHDGRVRVVAWSPDESRLLSVGDDERGAIWDAATGAVRHELRGHRGIVHAARFVEGGAVALTGGADRTLRAWDVASGRPLGEPRVLSQGIMALDLSPDGTRLAIGGFDGRIRILDFEAGDEVLTMLAHNLMPSDVRFTPDGNGLFSCARDRMVRFWHAEPADAVDPADSAGAASVH